jgi:hypothetical protein
MIDDHHQQQDRSKCIELDKSFHLACNKFYFQHCMMTSIYRYPRINTVSRATVLSIAREDDLGLLEGSGA